MLSPLKMIISGNVVFEAQFKLFPISWKSHIPSTLKVLTFFIIFANNVECILEYILNRKSFG